MEAQDNIIKKSIVMKSKQKINEEELAGRYSILDKTGLDKAKGFLKRQKEMIKKCNEDFENAKMMIFETNKRIDSERNSIIQRRSMMESQSRDRDHGGAMQLEENPMLDGADSLFDDGSVYNR